MNDEEVGVWDFGGGGEGGCALEEGASRKFTTEAQRHREEKNREKQLGRRAVEQVSRGFEPR